MAGWNNPRTRAAVTVVLAAGLLGCRPPARELVGGQIGYYRAPAHFFQRVRKVAFITLENDGRYPRVADDLSRSLLEAFQDRKQFHLYMIRHDDPVCEDLGLDRRGGLGIEDMDRIRRALGCDAVIYGRMTDFSPYPRARIGLRMNLVDLRDGVFLWQLDHVWNTGDEAVKRRLQHYYAAQIRNGYGPAQWELALMSPHHLEQFVAREVARTLTLAPPAEPAEKPAEPAPQRPPAREETRI
jgi:hypothetical protein